jgi:hypothetical protein
VKEKGCKFRETRYERLSFCSHLYARLPEPITQHGFHASFALNRAVRAVIFITFIWPGYMPNLSGLAAPVSAQTNQIAIQPSSSLPPKITTTDGQIYNNVKLLRVVTDGLVIEYSLTSSGTGLAKLKFEKLPESLQKQFGYDQKKVADYEKKQASAMAASSKKQAQTESTRVAIQNEMSHIAINVKAAVPTITYTYYDSAGPPPPHTGEDWAGYTSNEFKCVADLDCRPAQRGPEEPFNFHFDTMNVSLGLDIVIILPKNETGKLKDHEEGHRKIAEFFYALGPQTARVAGKTLTEDELLAYERDPESITPDVIIKTRLTNFAREYQKRIREVCSQANDYYDMLTDHGRNNMDTDQAVQSAILRYKPDSPN